ncbi:MAG TPA: cob(I)yrinic acid a,c-diamide adenosyltransferase [Casimicrobiaceae bacterium]
MSQSRIYTKLGDDGSTGLLFGGRIAKADPLIRTVGSIDETVAALGMARSFGADAESNETILRIQRDLFVIAADLMANPHARDRLTPGVSLVTADMVTRVEGLIDQLVARRPLRPVFIVPGANPASAALDLARAVVRRAEHNLAAAQLHIDTRHALNPQVRIYLNRVSDLLFVLARHAAGDGEEPLSHTAVGAS